MERVQGPSGYRLSSGRVIEAHKGILGIATEQPQHCYEGFDSEVWESFADVPEIAERHDPLTPEERVEIADYMIALWTQFKAPKAST